MQAQAVVAQAISKTAEILEQKVNEEIERLDNLTATDLMELRQQRLKKAQLMHQRKQIWLQKGHGKLTELPDEKMFYQEVKDNKRVVCHFFNPSNKFCGIVTEHLQRIAERHIETRFLAINVDKAPTVTQHLQIWMVPTIVLINDKKTNYSIVGLDELGGTGQFPTKLLESILVSHKSIDKAEEEEAEDEQLKHGDGEEIGNSAGIDDDELD